MSKAFYKTIEGKFNKKTTSLFSKVFCRIFGVSLHDESNNTTQIFSKKMHVPTYVAAWGKISMSKTIYKTIEGKKNYKKSNAVVFKRFLSRFSAFLCMASPKTPHKYFRKNARTYLRRRLGQNFHVENLLQNN
jgi:hypothetical protein